MNDTATSRGNRTRAALLKAATRIFGQAGFDAASTRAIAEAADANLALINYHFGGKQGLYEAVVETILAEMDLSITPALDQLAGNMPLEPAAAKEAILQLLSVLIEQFGREELHAWSRIIAREQQDPTAAFEMIYQGFMEPILQLLAALVEVASGSKLQGEAARLRAIFFMGQVLVFIYAPGTTGRYLGWKALDEKQRHAIRKQLQQVVQSQFEEFIK